MAGLSDLITRARQGDPNAAAELADLVEAAVAEPDRRVGTALGLRRRGGDPLATVRAQRDADLRRLAAAIPADSISSKARTVRQMVHRYETGAAWRVERNLPADGVTVRDLMRRVLQTGLPMPGRSRLIEIIRDGDQT